MEAFITNAGIVMKTFAPHMQGILILILAMFSVMGIMIIMWLCVNPDTQNASLLEEEDEKKIPDDIFNAKTDIFPPVTRRRKPYMNANKHSRHGRFDGRPPSWLENPKPMQEIINRRAQELLHDRVPETEDEKYEAQVLRDLLDSAKALNEYMRGGLPPDVTCGAPMSRKIRGSGGMEQQSQHCRR